MKNKKKGLKRLAKKVIRNIIYFIVGLVYFIYLVLRFVNKVATKLFNKLPKLAKVGVIYSMVGLSVLGLTSLKQETPITITENVVALESNNVEITETENIVVEEEIETIETITFENENDNNIYNESIKQGLTDLQARLVIAISRHETGHYKSKAFNENHNFGGIMCNGATKIKSYATYNEGLTDFVRILKNYYFDLGLDTPETIGAKYCPVGAKMTQMV